MNEKILAVPLSITLLGELEECGGWWYLDPLVLEVVAGMRARGLSTKMSCHGHADHGTLWPWVMVEPDGDSPTALYEVSFELVRAGYPYYPDDEMVISVAPLKPGGPLYFAPSYATAGGAAVHWWRDAIPADEQERILQRGQIEMCAFGGYLADGRPVSEHRHAATRTVDAAWAD